MVFYVVLSDTWNICLSGSSRVIIEKVLDEFILMCNDSLLMSQDLLSDVLYLHTTVNTLLKCFIDLFQPVEVVIKHDSFKNLLQLCFWRFSTEPVDVF